MMIIFVILIIVVILVIVVMVVVCLATVGNKVDSKNSVVHVIKQNQQ